MSTNENEAEDHPHVSFIDELVQRAEAPDVVEGAFLYHRTPVRETNPGDLLAVLGLTSAPLLPSAVQVLEFLEGESASLAVREGWRDFKWKLLAFQSLQDIFDAPLLRFKNDTRTLFRLWYFYYESKYILTEVVLAGLSGLYVSSSTLLRLLLEFTLFQNYFYRISRKTGSYEALEQYFANRIPPAQGTILKKAFPETPFAGPIRYRIESHLAALAASSCHPYHPIHSPKGYGNWKPEITLEGTLFWIGTQMALEAALWVYYVNFPMLFRPVNVERRFGFNSPLGLFVDESVGGLVRCTLSDADYALFSDYAEGCDEVQDLLAFYESEPERTDSEIMETWNTAENGAISSIDEGHCRQLMKMRVLREAMSWNPGELEDLEGLEAADVTSYAHWKAFQKSNRRASSKPARKGGSRRKS